MYKENKSLILYTDYPQRLLLTSLVLPKCYFQKPQTSILKTSTYATCK